MLKDFGGTKPNAYSVLFDNSPFAGVLLGPDMRVLGCNAEAMRFFGFATEEEFSERFIPMLLESIPPRQPTGRVSVPMRQRFERAVKSGFHEFVTELMFYGTPIPLNFVLRRVPYGDSFAVAVYISERREAEERLQTMLDATPLACSLLDITGRMVDCNMEAVRLFEFPSKDEYIERYMTVLPEIQPNGEDGRRHFMALVNRAYSAGCIEYNYVYRLRSGEYLPVEGAMSRVRWRDIYGVMIYSRDMRALETAKSDLKLHARLLQAVDTTSIKLIESGPDTFHDVVNESLKLIGTAANVDRAYIWQNFEQDGRMYTRQVFEWVNGVEPQQGKEFAVAANYDDFPYLKELLHSGRSLNSRVSDLSGRERTVLEMQGIKSVLLIPIHYRGNPWGFIGFDDCRSDKAFTTIHEQVLQSGGILIVSSILRNEMTRRIIDAGSELMAHEKLLRSVNEVARLLLESDQDDFFDTVRQALMTLGLCVNADRVSVWRNELDEREAMRSVRLAVWNKARPFELLRDMFELDYNEHIPGWYDSPGDVNVSLDEVDARFGSLSMLKGCRSIMLLPLNVHGDFWGVVAFVHEHEDHPFTEAEKGILRSGGMLIVSAIMRNEIIENLVEARENALASTRSKSEFLSRMSHEIRTPMNAIIGMTALAKKSDDTARIRHCLETVEASSQQLLGIINDVLDMSKIDANKLEIVSREFSFEGMLRRVLSVMHVKMNEKKLDFRLDFPKVFTRSVISDELRLSQVLINLLSNAVKFTPEGGSIRMKVAETPDGADHSLLHIEIIDSGIGISTDRLPHIFHSFEQGDGSITRQYGGTGLGLAICEHILTLMGGTIRVESELGAGSTFTVELGVRWGGPFDTESGGTSDGSEGGRTYDWRSRRILIAEDVDINREVVIGMLEDTGAVIDCAVNGLEAVEMFSKASGGYDLILMDVQMPVLDGLTATRRIRASGLPGAETVPIIAMTANAFKEDEQQSLEAGMTLHLAKPFGISELINTLAGVMGDDPLA